MILLRTIETSQDVYILGYADNETPSAFGTTDDYDSITLTNGKVEKHFETCGFVYILTKDELLARKPFMEADTLFAEHGGVANDEWGNDDYGIRLENFVGEIKVAYIQDGVDILKADANLEEYLRYEYVDELYDEDVEEQEIKIFLPAEYEFTTRPGELHELMKKVSE